VIALDTNLLIYAHRFRTPQHAPARKAIDRACAHHAGCGIPLPCLAEFWAIVTHATMTQRPSTPDEARRFIDSLTEQASAEVLLPHPGLERRLMKTAVDRGITGPRIHDLQIGMIALEQGATELWTHDAGFVALPGLKLVDPIRARGNP
jgi:hypothetical protein